MAQLGTPSEMRSMFASLTDASPPDLGEARIAGRSNLLPVLNHESVDTHP